MPKVGQDKEMTIGESILWIR